ncbi:unnamed protein product, partial [Acanthocheilonema viteae]
MHTRENPYKCEFCGRPFRSRNTLKAHSRTHIGGKPYECDVCDKAFTQSGNLERHARMAHEKITLEWNQYGGKSPQKSNFKKQKKVHKSRSMANET